MYFKPPKSAGTDQTVLALLQQGIEHLATCLSHIFGAGLACGYTPMAWRQVRLTFIPKPGKSDYTKDKAYDPISLLSFLSKMMEKLVITQWIGMIY
jgi:hypothetical protein